MATKKKQKKSKGKQAEAAATDQSAVATTFSSTIPWGKKGSEARVESLPLDYIVVEKGFNPRQTFNPDEMANLLKSIKTAGLIEPITVRPVKGKANVYRVINGERRFRLAKDELGWESIPAIIRDDLVDDDVSAQFIALTTGGGEAAVPLSRIERATRFAKFVKEEKFSPEEIAKRSGVSSRTVRDDLKLIEAPKDVLELVEHSGMGVAAALELAAIPTPKERKELVESLGDSLSSSAIKRAIKESAQEEVEETEGEATGKHNNRAKGKGRQANISVPRARGVVIDTMRLCCSSLLGLRNGGDKEEVEGPAFDGLVGLTYGLMWTAGEFKEDAVLPPLGDVQMDDIEPNQAARDKRLAGFWKRVEFHAAIYERDLAKSKKRQAESNGDDNADADGEEEGELAEVGADD